MRASKKPGWRYNRRMTDLQLALSIGIPSLLVLVGILINHARFGSIEGRLSTIEGDLRQFYRDQGRHEAEIANLKEKTRAL